MENVNLPINLVNGILQYLGSKPFVEVAQLISSIQQEVQSQIPPESPTPKESE